MNAKLTHYDTPLKGSSVRKKISVLLSEVEILEVMNALAAEFPDPRPALNFKNPFELLCAVLLSAQATDVSVNGVTPALFAAAPDPASMAALGADGIAPFIKRIGLWRAKSKNLELTSRKLLDEFQGQVPDDFAALTSLPGVGSKTANVVLNVAFHHPTIAVDTHIFRVCARTGLCVAKDARVTEEALPEIIPAAHKQEAHHRLLYHGRYVCTARKPKCEGCCISAWCRQARGASDEHSA